MRVISDFRSTPPDDEARRRAVTILVLFVLTLAFLSAPALVLVI
jgi:hypothetical protein